MDKADHAFRSKLAKNKRGKLKGDISLGISTVVSKYICELKAKERQSKQHYCE